MGHGVNLHVGLAVVVRVSKDARQKGVWSVQFTRSIIRYVSVSSNSDTEGGRGDLPWEDHRGCDGLWLEPVVAPVNVQSSYQLLMVAEGPLKLSGSMLLTVSLLPVYKLLTFVHIGV